MSAAVSASDSDSGANSDSGSNSDAQATPDSRANSDRGVLYVVATPIGNLEDMSYRAVRVLSEVAVIAAEDTRSAARLCNHFGIRGPRVVSMFEHNEAERSRALLAELRAGRDVAIISEAGMPGISDPGERMVAAAVAAELRVEVVPGAVAATAALVASGLPSGRFLFLGFPPRERGARRELFGSLRGDPATMLFYEAPDRVYETLCDLAAAFGDERPAALARELTKRYEEIARAPLAQLAARYAETAPRGECTLVVAGAREGDEVHAVLSLDDISARMRELLAQGLGPKDAAARLVVVTGKPRRQLYQLALSLKREHDAG
ncbi:16S rRNA (cytidine(1402)-2'-O)-methyltransferase [Haliangium ochraceum]|uniref:Ribosomal RNA small subunit methyltransferase I n=1 Tax=Haliangium ochraceum (strain DSM 14365 / JCM 11303 / SMP-2) TaxID=502025 RepID=D0LKK2_HALO1|nr:16S rRNA (cytidine(1402)-2'-O)-methyltransferase [Haliangium ochraceum]ACY15050.1 Uroporphyrin-III C/tetrapyrrole (Corrin/Porphyrin) methyltransferase [Haliangium ochraceum DSM 14365]